MKKAVTCEHCHLPYAEIDGAELVIRSRHHGRSHVNRVGAEQLRAWLAQLEARQTPN